MTPRSERNAVAAELLEAASRAIAAPSRASAVPGSVVGDLEPAGLRVVAIGWATVELDRAASELGASLDVAAGSWTQADRDPLLGAAAVLGPRLGPDPDSPRLVLLEPDTEGRLAASLARHGEGVAAVYVVDALAAPGGRARSVARSVAAAGPLGRGRLILGGPTWGPHVVVLDAAPHPESLPSAGD